MDDCRLVCPQCHNDVVTVMRDDIRRLTLVHCETCSFDFAANMDDYYSRYAFLTTERLIALIQHDWNLAYNSRSRLGGDTE